MLKRLSYIFLFITLAGLASCSSNRDTSKPVTDSQNQTELEDNLQDSANNPNSPKYNNNKYYSPRNAEEAANLTNSLNKSAAGYNADAKDQIFFGYDSADLSQSAQNTLGIHLNWLNENSSNSITIEGHCDERGTREYNLALGERRAKAAKDYLIENGVSAERVSIISYGKEKPAYFGSSEDIFSKNRRAVIVK